MAYLKLNFEVNMRGDFSLNIAKTDCIGEGSTLAEALRDLAQSVDDFNSRIADEDDDRLDDGIDELLCE